MIGYRAKKRLAIFLILFSVCVGISWELILRELFLFNKVPVLKTEIEKGTVVTPDMFDIVLTNAEGEYISENEMGTISGYEASQYIPAGVPVYRRYFRYGEGSGSYDSSEITLSHELLSGTMIGLHPGDSVSIMDASGHPVNGFIVIEEAADHIILRAEKAVTEKLARTIASGEKIIAIKENI